MLGIFFLLTVLSTCYAQSGCYPERPRPYPGSYSSGSESEEIVFPDGFVQPPQSSMKLLYCWKQLDYTFPNESIRQEMIENQQFIPKNNLILDVDVFDSGSGRRVFVTIPRVRPGVPVTLATVTTRRRRGAYLLQPFPDWASNTPGSCENGITSVFRTHIDKCGRLWVLDSGNNNAFTGNGRIVCPPQVLLYDLCNNNQLLGKFRIPSRMIENNTLLVTITVDIRNDNCNDTFAYIADSIAYKMIVFNLQNQQFWRIDSILFFPYPDQSRFTINGLSFDLRGGIFGLALGPRFGDDQRMLYFHCIDSVKQSWVDTADLRNQTLWQNNINAKPRAFNLFNGTRPSQSAAATMTDEGIMFFGLVASNEIACWNSRTKFEDSNIFRLAKDSETLQFNSGIKVYNNKIYVVTNRLQKYFNNEVNETEDNYRVLVGDVHKITQGTKCEGKLFSNRFETDYIPNTESVEHPNLPEFMLNNI